MVRAMKETDVKRNFAISREAIVSFIAGQIEGNNICVPCPLEEVEVSGVIRCFSLTGNS